MLNVQRYLPSLLRRAATVLLLSTAFLATSCDDDDDDDNTPPATSSNIVQVAQGNPDFSTLVAAVTKANLVGALSGTDQLTVLAPTNAAFARLDAPFNSAQNITAITDQSQIDALRGILLYHVLAGRVAAADFPNGPSTRTTQRPATSGRTDNVVYVSRSSAGVFFNGTARVATPDVQASNGIIHAIDYVLIPPSRTIAGIVQANAAASQPQFTQLLRALSRPAAAALLTAADNQQANLTVFAPTDAAFQALLSQQGATSLDQVSDDLLLRVLQLHIVNNTRAFSTDLSNNQTIPTLLSGQSVTIGINGNTVTVRGEGNGTTPATVAQANVLATNGVVHAIDRVLLPRP